MRASVTLSHPWTCSLSTPPIASLAPTFSSADDGDDDGGDGDGVDKWAMRCGAIDAATAWRPTSTADWARYCIHVHMLYWFDTCTSLKQ